MIPAHVKQLHESNVPFGQPAGEQAVGGIATRPFHIRAVRIKNALRFPREVNQVGHASLHTKCHFVLGNSSLDFIVADLFKVLMVQGCQAVERFSTRFCVNAWRIGQI